MTPVATTGAFRFSDLPSPIKIPSVRVRPIWILTAVMLVVCCARVLPYAVSHVNKVTNTVSTPSSP